MQTRQDMIFKTEYFLSRQKENKKRKDAKEHSTAYKVGGLGLETLRRVSKNFATELSVKYSTVHVY